MYTHFLQQSPWADFQRSLGKTVFTASESDFSYLAILEPTTLGPYLYCPYGPVLKTSASDPSIAQTALKHALKALKALAKREKCLFLRIEPTVALEASFLASQGLKKSKDINPANTWVLDLRPSQEELLKNFAQGTRTRFNQFKNKNLSVSVSKDPKDISHLIRLQSQLASLKNLNTFSSSYLESELSQSFSSLYLVHYTPDSSTDKIVSASLFFDDNKNHTRYYMQSATDPNYKKLPATVALLSTAIFDAKAQGLKSFDFWGIAPDNAPEDHPWAGFTSFKKSFGGASKSYSGTFDLPLNIPKYSLYTFLRRLNLRLRKSHLKKS